jgi:putative membrane protein
VKTAADVLCGVLALAHVWFLVLEMFLWRKPFGMKTFKMDQAFADRSAPLAMNQGLYNGFLAAGLVWGLLTQGPEAFTIKAFFVGCVFVAGVFGGLTASKAIFVLQALPGLVTGVVLFLSRG